MAVTVVVDALHFYWYPCWQQQHHRRFVSGCCFWKLGSGPLARLRWRCCCCCCCDFCCCCPPRTTRKLPPASCCSGRPCAVVALAAAAAAAAARRIRRFRFFSPYPTDPSCFVAVAASIGTAIGTAKTFVVSGCTTTHSVSAWIFFCFVLCVLVVFPLCRFRCRFCCRRLRPRSALWYPIRNTKKFPW